jgi:hypothetical protein
LPEESAFFLALMKKQIPRCARDDKIADFFGGLFKPCRKETKIDAALAAGPLEIKLPHNAGSPP